MTSEQGMTSPGTVTSSRRPLHYGDLIYLSTSGGSVGNFYPFSSLNNLLLLDHESSLDSAQAMWCTFRILPPYQLVLVVYIQMPELVNYQNLRSSKNYNLPTMVYEYVHAVDNKTPYSGTFHAFHHSAIHSNIFRLFNSVSFRFNDQAALKKELKRSQKDWVTISNLEKEVHHETVDNKKRFVRSLSRTVRYLQVSLQLWFLLF